MNIAIIGASGFIGSNLISKLLTDTNHDIIAISHNINNIQIPIIYTNRVRIIKADVLNFDEINNALSNVDVAYYLVHMMADKRNNFFELETIAA